MANKTQDNTLPILIHILGLLTGFLAPLIIYFVTKEEYVKNHAKTALNWHFSLMIYFVISGILVIVLIGFLAIFALAIMNFVFCIIAAVKANNNEVWKYPMSIPFFKI